MACSIFFKSTHGNKFVDNVITYVTSTVSETETAVFHRKSREFNTSFEQVLKKITSILLDLFQVDDKV